MQREKFHQQTHYNDTFHQPNISKAQFVKGTENYPNARRKCHWVHDKMVEVLGGFFSSKRHLTEDNFLQTKITQKNFTGSNDYAEHSRPGSILCF